MRNLRRNGWIITPEFTEEGFISALETALNRSIYYRDKFVEIRRISQSDENELGYDGVLTAIVPFYLQFKRSYFYTNQYTGALTSQRNELGFHDNIGFFAFQPLKKNNYHQHNVLYRLSNKRKSAYVAPMFYKSKDLSNFKFQSQEGHPIVRGNIDFRYLNNRQQINLDINWYIFRETITIKPHREIDDNMIHSYSYSRRLETCFHSNAERLDKSESKTLLSFLEDIISDGEKDKKPEEIFDELHDFFNLDKNSEEFLSILYESISRIFMIDEGFKCKRPAKYILSV